jgi:hypothetical protein
MNVFSSVIARVYPKQSIKGHSNWIASPLAVRNDENKRTYFFNLIKPLTGIFNK